MKLFHHRPEGEMKKLNVDGGSNSRDVAQPSIRHQPATALPWITMERNKQVVGDMNTIVVGARRTLNGKLDSEYIAHAANAYPKLVAHLLRLEDHLKRGAPAEEGHYIRHEQVNLLRELGEEAQ